MCLALRVFSCLAVLASVLAGSSAHAQQSSRPFTHVTVAMNFIPNVQFAPYYLAQDLGYYRQAGLQVSLQYQQLSDPMSQLANGRLDFAVASADQVVEARAAGIPVTYVMAQFQRYPVGAMALSSVPLRSPADLRGRTIGISGPGSPTDLGLDALLYAGHIPRGAVRVRNIGFTETEALLQKRVDVAMTFITNEPVQVRALGYATHVLPVSRYLPLVSTGVVAGQSNVRRRPRLVEAFVRATLRGLRAALRHPRQAFAASMKRTPEITGNDVQIQRQVLAHTLAFERPPHGHVLGWTDPRRWQRTVHFLAATGHLKRHVAYSSVFTNSFAVRAGI